MTGPYINDPGHEVPENTILVVPHSLNSDGFYPEVIEPLYGKTKRDWFTSHFYYCLPLIIGNQYGFLIKSMRDFEIIWDGTHNDAKINFLNDDNDYKQTIINGFSQGIVTVQNRFALKTPPNINIMTIQPPNMFIEGCSIMTGVIETDQIRRDFTFNIKITIPNRKIQIKKGDPLGAFIPIPRNFVENFKLNLVTDLFDKSFHEKEIVESQNLSKERNSTDLEKPHKAGRRYFSGIHSDGEIYKNHQKRL